MSFKVLSSNLNKSFLRKKFNSLVKHRTILSPAYNCTEDWNKRLEEPLIKNVDLDYFFHDLNNKLKQKTSVRPTDVDIFLNKAPKNIYQEVIIVLENFRKNWRSRGILDSTHHSFIRLMLEAEQYDKLILVLTNRVKYGIFPDKFSYNLLLDCFLERKDYEKAAKVAILRMLQEDFVSEIGNILSFKSIHSYLQEKNINLEIFKERIDDENLEQNEENKEEEEDDDEVEYIRQPYLRNPFFDDHFDIKNTYHLIGKTFYLLASNLKTEDEFKNTCIIYGLCLYEKYNQLLSFVGSNSNLKVSKDLVSLIEKHLNKIEKQDDLREKILNSVKSIKNLSSNTLEQLIEAKLPEINKLEKDEILEMKNFFKSSEKTRELKLKKELDEILREEMIDKIKTKKEEFESQELKLFFFENLEKMEYLEHQAKENIKKMEESMKIEEEYIPPTVKKNRNN